MKSLLEEMYVRNLKPINDSRERFQKACELSGLIERHEKRLKELLGEEGLETLEKYLDCNHEMVLMDNCDEFIAGFRLGGRIVIEILFGTEDFKLQD